MFSVCIYYPIIYMYIIRVKPRLFHQPCARAPESGAFYLYIYICM